MWVCLIWWMWVCVGGGFGMWVCADLSGCVLFFIFYFFFEVALVDVGLCRWWLSVLLRQWLLVAIVAAVVLVSLLMLLTMMMIGTS